MKPSVCRSQNGFTFIEIFAAIAIAGLVAMGAAALFQQLNQTQVKSERLFWISARKMEFQNVVRSDTGWGQILASNATMACLADPTQNCLAYKTPQALRLPIDGNILDGTNPALGMNNAGDFCYEYDDANGNSRCPIGVSLRWQAICNDVQCHHPQPKITVDFKINDSQSGTQQVINANNQLVVFRDQTLQTLNDVCTSMGGTLVAGVCTMPQLTSACDPANGSFVLGFDSQGLVMCGKPNPGNCANGDVGYGFAANGAILCAAGSGGGSGPGGMCMTCAAQCPGGVPAGANGGNCRCGDGTYQFCL